MRDYTDRMVLLNEVAANSSTAAGVANFVEFRNVELEVVMTGFTGTIKIQGSNADACPTFSSAASLSNPWDYVKCINLIDGSAVNGGTGLTGAATTSVTQMEVNTNGMRWVGATISGYSAGTITLRAKGYTNT